MPDPHAPSWRSDHARRRVSACERAQPGDRLRAVGCGDGGELAVLGPMVVEGVGHIGQPRPRRLRLSIQSARRPAIDAIRAGVFPVTTKRADRWFRLRRCVFHGVGDRGLLDHARGRWCR